MRPPSTVEAFNRIRSEAANPRATCWIGGPSVKYAAAAEAGLFQPYRPALNYEIPDRYHDKSWRWTGIYLGALAFGTNKKFVAENKLDPPTSWNDLLRPEYKGKVGFALPYTSGTALVMLLGTVQRLGEELAFKYLISLDKQVKTYTRAGAACVGQVGVGEIGVCLTFSQDILSMGIGKGYPITLSFPKEGTIYEIGGSALIKNAPAIEKGRRFLDWLQTPAAQGVFSRWHQTPLDPAVPMKEPAVRVTDLSLIDTDNDWAAQHQDRLIARWRKTMEK